MLDNMKNFHKVNDKLYRGAAPSVNDIKNLKKLGVKRIVSLDENAGEAVSDICKKLELEQLKLYFRLNKSDINMMYKRDWVKILMSVPTYVHCLHGKDRTGFVVGLAQVRSGVSADEAIKLADQYGLGRNLPPHFESDIKLIKNLIKKDGTDTNSSDDTAPEVSREDNNSMNSPFAMNNLMMNYYEPAKNPIYQLTYEPRGYEDQVENKAEPVSDIPQMGQIDGVYAPVGAGYSMASGISRDLGYMKIANTPLVIDIPDAEKKAAAKCIATLKLCLKELDIANNHIAMILSAFEKFPDTDIEKVYKSRVMLRKIRDQGIENFNEFELPASKFIKEFNIFTSDQEFDKLVKSFISDIGDLKGLLKDFTDLYDDMRDKDFVKNIIVALKAIESQCKSLESLIDERIISDIKTKIITEDWYARLQEKEST